MKRMAFGVVLFLKGDVLLLGQRVNTVKWGFQT